MGKKQPDNYLGKGIMALLIGILFTIGGVTGSLVLRGTENSLILVVFGVLLIAVAGLNFKYHKAELDKQAEQAGQPRQTISDKWRTILDKWRSLSPRLRFSVILITTIGLCSLLFFVVLPILLYS